MVLSETRARLVTGVASRFFWSSEGDYGWASASGVDWLPGRTDPLRLTLEPCRIALAFGGGRWPA
jgi:hypothetical protein